MYGQVLTQKVNFVISATFISVFGIFLTITVVHAIGADLPIFQNLSTPIGMSE